VSSKPFQMACILGDQAAKLLEVKRGEALKMTCAEGRELEADHALVIGVECPLDRACGSRPVHQLDGAVVAEEQVVGDLADDRCPGVVVAAP